MKKLLTIVSITLLTQSAFCAPAFCQQLTLEQMMRMTGSNEPHLSALGSQFDTRGLQSSNSRSFVAAGQYRYSGTAGNAGDYGNQTYRSYNQANQDYSQSDYQGETANQSPYSRGGLPETNTTMESLNGGFGKRFGKSEIPSGTFKYGFTNPPPNNYRNITRRRTDPYRSLPSVSTASVDIDIVDR